MVSAQKLYIFGRFLAAHTVMDDLKYALKARCCYDMKQLFCQSVTEFIGVVDSLHIFVCVFNLDTHEFIYKIVKARTIGRIEKQTELVQMLIHIIYKLRCAAVGIFRHQLGLFTVENLEEFLEMSELPEPAKYAGIKHTDVELKDVHFSYTGDTKDEVLHGVNLKLPEGSFTALVGPSGGGKSTVAKLIARFWDVTDGEITVGGVNVKDMPLSQLSEYVSFVTQDNFLFRCSLLENIRLGNPNATDEEVRAAARAAQCEEFINKLPQGYDTSAGEAGKRLSGGEKQRIAIARMMLKNAPIVILDEATAFTDPENEDKIQRSIAALTKGKTLLVIAHRLSTIRNADNIVVLKNGKIKAEGNQEELLADCPLYRDMWQAHIGAKNWAVSAAEKEA